MSVCHCSRGRSIALVRPSAVFRNWVRPYAKVPRVTRVMEGVEDVRIVERSPAQLAFVRSGPQPPGEEQLPFPEAAHGGGGRADASEGVEEGTQGGLNLEVGVQDDLAVRRVDEPHREADLQLATAGLGQDAADEAGTEHVQLGLAHGPLESEQQTVVELAGVVEAVLIQYQGVGQRADLEQPVPIRGVAREPILFDDAPDT